MKNLIRITVVALSLIACTGEESKSQLLKVDTIVGTWQSHQENAFFEDDVLDGVVDGWIPATRDYRITLNADGTFSNTLFRGGALDSYTGSYTYINNVLTMIYDDLGGNVPIGSRSGEWIEDVSFDNGMLVLAHRWRACIDNGGCVERYIRVQ